MLDFHAQFVAPGDLCFDVGANVGNRTRALLKLGARVVAIEPQTACIGTLKLLYGRNRRFTLLPVALGAAEGEAELLVSETSVLTSLSPEWIAAVQSSGRFAEYAWRQKQTTPITTLDKLIERYGVPALIKIDVEGYEHQVLKGLSQPVRVLSFEFVPECIAAAYRCLDHLGSLGEMRLNYTLAESMGLVLAEWVSVEEMVHILASFQGDNRAFGDVYVQFLVRPDAPAGPP
jgi:FkbM family methyltransferase